MTDAPTSQPRAVAVLDMSEAAGMRRLVPNEYNPLVASTFGVGEMLLAAARREANPVIIGLGGSATTDGGVGLARALGRPSLITHQGDVVMPAGLFNSIIQQGEKVMALGFQLATRVVVHSADYGRNSAFLAPIAHKLDAIYPPAELPVPQPFIILNDPKSLLAGVGPVSRTRSAEKYRRNASATRLLAAGSLTVRG